MADAPSEIHTWGERKFCDIPDTCLNSAIERKEGNEDCRKLCEYIERQCLGKDFEFTGPFGKRKGLSLRTAVHKSSYWRNRLCLKLIKICL